MPSETGSGGEGPQHSCHAEENEGQRSDGEKVGASLVHKGFQSPVPRTHKVSKIPWYPTVNDSFPLKQAGTGPWGEIQ